MIVSSGLKLADGRYELGSLIAVGGMGEVWRGHDTWASRTVAIKVLRPEFTGDEASLHRLRTEAHNAAMLNHPNIARVYDYREEDGTGYLVLEFVPGQSLADVLAVQSTLPAAQLIEILHQCAEGLFAAHRAGVVHRDVKPGNILLGPGGRVKLTDFGISVCLGQAALTATGKVMGTAQYLAPEQALGKPATPAGDMYALGIIAYECLAGTRPFNTGGDVDIALAQVRQPPPPLPAWVDPPLRDLIGRLLAKDPAKRPATCGELAHALLALKPLPPDPSPDTSPVTVVTAGPTADAAPTANQSALPAADRAGSVRSTRSRAAEPGLSAPAGVGADGSADTANLGEPLVPDPATAPAEDASANRLPAQAPAVAPSAGVSTAHVAVASEPAGESLEAPRTAPESATARPEAAGSGPRPDGPPEAPASSAPAPPSPTPPAPAPQPDAGSEARQDSPPAADQTGDPSPQRSGGATATEPFPVKPPPGTKTPPVGQVRGFGPTPPGTVPARGRPRARRAGQPAGPPPEPRARSRPTRPKPSRGATPPDGERRPLSASPRRPSAVGAAIPFALLLLCLAAIIAGIVLSGPGETLSWPGGTSGNSFNTATMAPCATDAGGRGIIRGGTLIPCSLAAVA
jgi:serine/threonine-protein kinase